ncbi:MAG: type II toxin-antitoxin system HicA family toxin [Methanobacteriota archaeon]|nr:MAG: type II toxin-antitoxin system HicA family toxin [Euryarchaeota archaeon]
MSTACKREQLIEKLQELNFYGPVTYAGQQFMIYHGYSFVLPNHEEITIPQFRMLLSEIENIVSKEEWQY